MKKSLFLLFAATLVSMSAGGVRAQNQQAPPPVPSKIEKIAPHSDQMRLQERYRRVAADRLELTLTVADPVIYAKPFQSDTKVFTLLTKDKLTLYGWMGLQENLCAPIDEVDFNLRVRNPAAIPQSK